MKNYKFIVAIIALLTIGYSCSEDTLDIVKTGSLTGTVIASEDGEALEGVKITTTPASTTVFTDAAGAFSIPSIEVDDYSVQAELDGFATSFEPASISEDQNTVVALELDIAQSDNLVPLQPELVTPEDGAIDVAQDVDFVWLSSKNDLDEIIYKLSLRNGTTNEVQEFEVPQDTILTVNNLQISTNYFWQVTADDEINDPVTSALSSFTTVSIPNNPFLFVRELAGNNVIFSGGEDDTPGEGMPDFNVVQLTDDEKNSFRPRKNIEVGKIAFLRSVGSQTHIFTMDLDGTNVAQITNNVPVGGFRLSELDFTWAVNGRKLYYPNFDKIYEIDPDAGGASVLYTSNDGFFISEVAVPDFDQDLLLIKTNDINGYNVRIFTYRLSTGVEETVILEGEPGAAGSIDITANADRVLYNRDLSGSENTDYRLFQSRLFIYDLNTDMIEMLDTDVDSGENDFDGQFTPSEGGVIWTRKASNINSIPEILLRDLQNATDDTSLFTNSFMPDWE
tara:strand:- start:29893 stop:31413 length:1521 start_codon:yes stop_codon:yes gene_type:complete